MNIVINIEEIEAILIPSSKALKNKMKENAIEKEFKLLYNQSVRFGAQ